ncbi:MAG: DoxX family protein [Ardenticatenaceae bacterium]
MLTAAGLLHPLGPLSIISAMSVATGTAHRGKPIWVTQGGAELPVTNIAIALALVLAWPGSYSVDEALDIELPKWLVGLVTLASLLGVAQSLVAKKPQPEKAMAQEV